MALFKLSQDTHRYYETVDNPREVFLLAQVRKYTQLELARLATRKSPDVQTQLDLGGFAEVSNGNEGVLWTIEEAHQPREVDAAIYLFARLSTLFGGGVRFNSNQAGKAEGKGKFYPVLRIAAAQFSLLRVIMDAGPGERVEENVAFHNNLRRHMRCIRDEHTESHGTKFLLGRSEAMAAALSSYDESQASASAWLSREELSLLLWSLLLISDLHSQDSYRPNPSNV